MTRLAYLLKKFPRLSETFILNELLGQEEIGRELTVFSRRAPDDEPRHPQLARLKATVETLPHPRSIDPWSVLFAEDWDPEEVFSRVGRVVRMAREWNHDRFPSLLSEALYLLRRTSELGIQHLHVHFATDSAVTAMLLKELGGPSYSITAHAKDIYRNTVDPALLDRLIARASFVVTVCDANVEFVRGKVGPDAAANVRRLYNGIDLGSFAFNENGRDATHVLAVGRLVEKKGFDVLIDAAALLAQRGVDCRFSIVGTGDQEESLAARIGERGVADRVQLLGAQDQAVVRDLMVKSTLMCLPCRIGEDGNRDALPTVLLEALATGLPCISTPVTGVPEILGGGETGVLVPEDDVPATADAIASLLGSPERRLELAHKGRLHAEKLFDVRTQAEVLHGWFDQALNGEENRCASPS